MCGSVFKKVGRAIEKPFRTGASSAKASAQRQQQEQQKAVAEQQKRVDRERQKEEERKRAIASGKQQLESIFGGLTGADGSSPLWEQQQQAYLDFAQPQLQDQYGDAQKQLTYALANQGQLGGSISGDRFGKLDRDFQLQQQEVGDRARGYATRARGDIEQQRQSLLSTLNSTADVNAVTTSARNQVGTMQQMPSFSALGPLFQNATAGLGSHMSGRQNNEINQRTQGIIYGGDPDRGSGRVIR